MRRMLINVVLQLKEEVADVVGRLEKLKHLDALQPTLDTLWQEDSSCREDDKWLVHSDLPAKTRKHNQNEA